MRGGIVVGEPNPARPATSKPILQGAPGLLSPHPVPQDMPMSPWEKPPWGHGDTAGAEHHLLGTPCCTGASLPTALAGHTHRWPREAGLALETLQRDES